MTNERLSELKTLFETILTDCLSQCHSSCPTLIEAMKYACFTPGKRLRPLLVYSTGLSLGTPIEKLHPAALAVELTHCYSLVHDDLPAMDDDDMRRGQPTCHKAFDEATAILVGDALQGLAIQILLENDLLSAEQKNNMSLNLINACGINGMVAGQSLDLIELSQSSISEERLQLIHQLKTGRLLSSCVKLAVLASAPQNKHTVAQLDLFSQHLGLAFQMQDDYLDCYVETSLLGKNQGSDISQNKMTYATLFDKEALAEKYKGQYNMAISALEAIDNKFPLLVTLAEKMKSRGY